MGGQSSGMAAPVVVSATAKHTATIIFLHGLGDTGHGWASSLASVGAPHIKIICPTAPMMPVTINAGFTMPSWFDLKSLAIDGEEDADGIRSARDRIQEMIRREVKDSGIPANRIMIGGFSQGGALAMYSALTFPNTLAGVVGLSCWLPLRNDFPDAIKGNTETSFLQCHGEIDPVVPFKFGHLTCQMMRQFVPNLEFHAYKDLMHSSSDEEMKQFKAFVAKCIPPQ